MKILHVVGARPNFPKVAPLLRAMNARSGGFEQMLVHTGQHYDYNMSKIFFEELEMPEPDVHLNVGAGSHADQTARVMLAFEPVVLKYRPDWVVVVGDVNSTLACALVCAKLGVRVAHVEAGLRSWDRAMPEEINRILTDQVSDLLFTPSRDGDQNLLREGISPEKIHFVGNIMVDSLVRSLPKAIVRPTLHQNGLTAGSYILVTLHRPSNVDDPGVLLEILTALEEVGRELPVVFPVHPRTRKNIAALGDASSFKYLHLLEPLGYLDFLALTQSARLVLTDSGGIQEETTFMWIPCLTARQSTERPVTITHGTNRLVASTKECILQAVRDALTARQKPALTPELWDGLTAERIVDIFQKRY